VVFCQRQRCFGEDVLQLGVFFFFVQCFAQLMSCRENSTNSWLSQKSYISRFGENADCTRKWRSKPFPSLFGSIHKKKAAMTEDCTSRDQASLRGGFESGQSGTSAGESRRRAGALNHRTPIRILIRLARLRMRCHKCFLIIDISANVSVNAVVITDSFQMLSPMLSLKSDAPLMSCPKYPIPGHFAYDRTGPKSSLFQT
jgi:hypothetical protein